MSATRPNDNVRLVLSMIPQVRIYTASWRAGAGWSATVFAQESPTCSARFDAENDLYSFALTVPMRLLLEQAPHGPCLVIAPTSVCHNWENELTRFAPSAAFDRPARTLLRLKALVGVATNKSDFLTMANASVIAALGGVSLTYNMVNPMLNRLLSLGLLNADFACVELLRHPLAIEMIAAPLTPFPRRTPRATRRRFRASPIVARGPRRESSVSRLATRLAWRARRYRPH